MNAGWLRTSALLLGCCGCMSLKDLSSYSAGSDQVTPERLEAHPTPAGEHPNAADARPVDVGLTPTDVGMSDGERPGTALGSMPESSPLAEPPPAAVPRAFDAGGSCAALGGFMMSGSSSCYMLGDNVFSWADARSYCQAWGGDLVQIDSPEENAALSGRIVGSVWIGANDRDAEGTFYWARGNPLEYQAWAFGQPNNLQGAENCAELRAFDARWSDVACDGEISRRALCERATAAASATSD